MPAIIVESPGDLPAARAKYYAALAEYFLKQLGQRPLATILEAGSGKGQLTIPLVGRLPRRITLIAVDSSKGPYAGSFEQLTSALKQRSFGQRVRPITSDVRRIKQVKETSVDAVISNELFCDLPDEVQLERALREFHRVLRPGGVMVHGEWSSWPANKCQALTLKADSSSGTDTPSKFWNHDDLFVVMERVGFRDVSATYFETTVRLRYAAAIEELRNWGVRGSFLKRNDRLLRRNGIELPYEHIVKSRKPARPLKS